MGYKASNDLSQPMLAAAKTALDGGTLIVFSGTVPPSADDALDMGAVHTSLATLTVDGDGVTGITFDAAVDDVVSKAAAESWEGLVAFSGFQDTETSLAPTFFRFCGPGDDGIGAAAGPRLQGTAGGPTSPADLKLGAALLTDNGTNTAGVSVFNLRLSALA